MILTLTLAAATALTFEGIALGDDAAKIAAAHTGHSTFTALGPGYSWRRSGGGTMLIAGDAKGKVAVVDFVADQGEADAIDLPNAPGFSVQGTHEQLASALGTPAATCPSNYMSGFCGAFDLAGGSEIVTQFEGPNSGQLHRATWGTPDILTKLQLIQPVISP